MAGGGVNDPQGVAFAGCSGLSPPMLAGHHAEAALLDRRVAELATSRGSFVVLSLDPPRSAVS